MTALVAHPPPPTHPAQGLSSLQEDTQSGSITAHLSSSLNCCLPPCPFKEGVDEVTVLPSLAPPQPEGWGTLLIEVKGRLFSSSHMLHPAGLSSPPPEHSLLGKESCIQALHFVPVGVLGLVAACMILQESQVCRIPGGSWHEADPPRMVPHQKSEDISPLRPTHNPHRFLSVGETPIPEAQVSGFLVSRMAAGSTQAAILTGETLSPGFTRSWESLRGKQGQFSYYSPPGQSQAISISIQLVFSSTLSHPDKCH